MYPLLGWPPLELSSVKNQKEAILADIFNFLLLKIS